MNNPYAWAFLSLCTIVSFAFAIYTWIVGRKTKEISIDYYSNDIIKQGKDPISKLDIKFDGKEIHDLSSTFFYIWNSGNDVINIEDIVSTKQLRIKSKSNNILDVHIIKQSDDSNSFSIMNFTSTNIEIAFEYMDSGEGVLLQVLHTDSKNDLFVDCKIKGGKPIRDCIELKKDKGIYRFLTNCFDELMPMILLIISGCVSIMLLKLIGIPTNDNSILVPLFIVIVTIVMEFMYYKAKKKINMAFHRTIPNELKR